MAALMPLHMLLGHDLRRRLMWRGWRGMTDSDWIPDDFTVYPHCRLCRLGYEEGDEFIAVSSQGRMSAPHRFQPGVLLYDEYLENGLFCESSFSSIEPSVFVVGCHPECIAFASKVLDARETQGLPRLRRRGDDLIMELKLRILSSDTIYSKRMFGGHDLGTMRPCPRKRATPVSKALVKRLFEGNGSWHRRMLADNKAQRLRHIETQLIRNAAAALDPQRKLPLEIWTMIAGYLATTYGTAAFAWVPRSKSSTVVRTRDIWATYIKIDGKIYLSKLSNKQTPGSMLLMRGHSNKNQTTLHIKEDHVGIRNIFLTRAAPPFTTPPEDPTRWRIHIINKDEEVLAFVSDGTVLQHYVTDHGYQMIATHEEVYERCSWPEPVRAVELARLRCLNVKSTMGWMRPGDMPTEIEIIMIDWDIEMSWRSQFKMRDLPLNRPSCMGYSACWVTHVASGRRDSRDMRASKPNPIHLVGLHAHEPGDSLDFYRQVDCETPRTFWSYIPLQAGEQITRIWGKRGRDDRLTLSWDTTLDRRVTVGALGADKTLFNSLDSWHCIATPTRANPDRLWMRYLDWNGGTVRSLAGPVRDGAPRRAPGPSQTLVPRAPDPLPFLLHSEAGLRGVAKVTACRASRDARSTRISGLLFHFSSGKREAVGSVRLDCLDDEAVAVPSDSRGLALRLGGAREQRRVEEFAVVKAGSETLESDWSLFPWHGTLVWWFDHATCSIMHGADDAINTLEL